MNYSLGNMLSNGGALNPDGLALDLQLAADKTLTARKGPTPTFTRASTATFVGSNGLIQSAAINTPRFDHNSVTLASRGLLIEESRTNVALRSEEFNESAWVKNGLIAAAPTVTANQVNSPSGVLSADRIAFPAVSGAGAFSLAAQSIALVSGVVYTASIYLRGLNGGEKVWWSWTPNGSTYARKECVLTTSWQRFDVTFTASAVANFIQIGVDLRDASQSAQSAQTIFAWGAQLEAGSFPTSYIPTTTASVVRSADVCSITGSDFSGMWNRFAGTCIINVGSSLGSSPRFISNLVGARTLEIYGTTNIDFFEAAGAQEVRIVSSPTFPIKLGLAYAINDYQSAYNGSLGGSDTNTGGTIPDATALHIGSLGGSTGRLTGHIQSIRYYKKRLANAKLQSLTT